MPVLPSRNLASQPEQPEIPPKTRRATSLKEKSRFSNFSAGADLVWRKSLTQIDQGCRDLVIRWRSADLCRNPAILNRNSSHHFAEESNCSSGSLAEDLVK